MNPTMQTEASAFVEPTVNPESDTSTPNPSTGDSKSSESSSSLDSRCSSPTPDVFPEGFDDSYIDHLSFSVRAF
jgi:hypothetical protein